MTRKLASIQIVTEVNPIEGADRIEQIKVLGWSLVARKGEFKPGDACCFFEIDAILPEGKPWAEFMRDRKFRVKTVKMRGCLSQGLALPIDILPKVPVGATAFTIPVTKEQTISRDVTELLGVRKYEPPETGGVNGFVYGAPMPLFVPRTDEWRVQSAPTLIDEIKQHDFYWTVKLDGISATYIRTDRDYALWKRGDLIVCNRRVATREDPDDKGTFWLMARKYDLAKKLPIGIAVQGEIMGPKIAGNKLNLEEHDLFIFSVYDLMESKFLDLYEMLVFCRNHGLKTVPLDGLRFEADEHLNPPAGSIVAAIVREFPFRNIYPIRTETQIPCDMGWFLNLAQGNYDGTQNRREGIVVRPVKSGIDSPTLRGLINLETESPRLTFKVLNNSFLLKDEA